MTGWKIQSFRYVAVGLLSNLALYLIYLVVTAVGVGHKTAMTVLYVVGTLQTFVFNRAWTFDHRGHLRHSLIRYVTAYGGCYLINLALLYVFVDWLEFSHGLVQGFAILGLAVLLFLLQKFWIFPRSHSDPRVTTNAA